MKLQYMCLDSALDLWAPDHFELGFFASRIRRSEIECSASPLRTEFPVFWEFLGIPRNSQKFPIMQMTLANWIPTSFPGSLIFSPPGTSKERPWFRLVTCLPDFSRLQIRGLREGRISENLSPLSPLSSVATREALRTELCQLGIFSRRPKK